MAAAEGQGKYLFAKEERVNQNRTRQLMRYRQHRYYQPKQDEQTDVLLDEPQSAESEGASAGEDLRSDADVEQRRAKVERTL